MLSSENECLDCEGSGYSFHWAGALPDKTICHSCSGTGHSGLKAINILLDWLAGLIMFIIIVMFPVFLLSGDIGYSSYIAVTSILILLFGVYLILNQRRNTMKNNILMLKELEK